MQEIPLVSEEDKETTKHIKKSLKLSEALINLAVSEQFPES